MASHVVRNLIVFFVYLLYLCCKNTVSLAVTWVQRFYSSARVRILRTKSFGFGVMEALKLMPKGQCPPFVSVNDGLCSTSESEKLSQNIKKWDLARIFNAWDDDRDGVISRDGIQALLEKLGLHYYSDEDLKLMTDFPEQMSFDEFCRVCLSLVDNFQFEQSLNPLSVQEELKETFCVFDTDGDGFITPSELKNVLLNLGFKEANDLENCLAMIAKFDKNSDGRIDYQEFENMMATLN